MHVTTRITIDAEENQQDSATGDRDAGGNNAPNLPQPVAPPTPPPAGRGINVPGRGDGPDNGDENMEDNDSNKKRCNLDASNEDEPEDPEQAGMGTFYQAQTQNWKQMVKMFRRFCDLTVQDANAFVMYFAVHSKACLAEFLHEHWKDTFTQWQKCHPNQDGTKQAMVLLPPQQERICCAA